MFFGFTFIELYNTHVDIFRREYLRVDKFLIATVLPQFFAVVTVGHLT